MTEHENPHGLITAEKAAKLAAENGRPVSSRRIRQVAEKGRLRFYLFGRFWMFAEADVIAWATAERLKGRPKKAETDPKNSSST